MKIRTRQDDGVTTVRLLMTHPMETGRRRDDVTDQLVPAHFIEKVTLQHRGRIVATAHFTTAVSRDPYLSIRFRGARTGDTIQVSWVDNRGETGHAEHVIDSRRQPGD